MEPIEWTEDGWYRIPDWSSPAKPLPIPQGGVAVTHGYPTAIQFPEKILCQGNGFTMEPPGREAKTSHRD